MHHMPNSCALWMTYGCFKEDNTVILVNLIGFLLFISYTLIYFVYTTDKVLCNLCMYTTVTFPCYAAAGYVLTNELGVPKKPGNILIRVKIDTLNF